MPRDLTTAQTELAEARTALETLTEQVRDGDQDVTPQQLAAQRELIAFAELRVEAAERTEARYREDERAALAAAAKQATEQLITGSGMDEIAAATKAAADAIAALSALAYARNEKIAEIGTSLARLDTDIATATDGPRDEGPWASRRYGVWGDRTAVAVPGVGVAPRLDVGVLAAAAVVAGLGTSPEGREAQTRHVGAFNGLRNQVVCNLLEQYPQLAEALRATPGEFKAADTKGRYDLTEQGRRPLIEGSEG